MTGHYKTTCPWLWFWTVNQIVCTSMCRYIYERKKSDGKQQCHCKFHDDDDVCTGGCGQFSCSAMKRSVKLSKCILKRQLFRRSGMLNTKRYPSKRHTCDMMHYSHHIYYMVLAMSLSGYLQLTV